MDKKVKRRKQVYVVFLAAGIFVLANAFRYWIDPPPVWGRAGLFGELADVFDYFLPVFFGGLIEVAVVQQPLYLVAAIIFGWVLWKYRKIFVMDKIHNSAEDLRRLVIDNCGTGSSSATSTGEDQ